MSRLTVTQASVTSLLVYAVGQLVAYVPALAPVKADAISTGTLVIAVAFMAVHAFHALLGLINDVIAGRVKLSLSDLEAGVRSLARDEIGKANLTADAEKVLAGKIPTEAQIAAVVQGELRKLLSASASAVPAAPAPAVPADPAPADPAQG